MSNQSEKLEPNATEQGRVLGRGHGPGPTRESKRVDGRGAWPSAGNGWAGFRGPSVGPVPPPGLSPRARGRAWGPWALALSPGARRHTRAVSYIFLSGGAFTKIPLGLLYSNCGDGSVLVFYALSLRSRPPRPLHGLPAEGPSFRRPSHARAGALSVEPLAYPKLRCGTLGLEASKAAVGPRPGHEAFARGTKPPQRAPAQSGARGLPVHWLSPLLSSALSAIFGAMCCRLYCAALSAAVFARA